MMKKFFLPILVLVFAYSSYLVQPASAQDDSPPAPEGPVGEIRGTIINRNSGEIVAKNLEIMLHVLDLDYVDRNMVHGQSQADGTFVFPDVPFDANTLFAVMSTYDGVTYSSETVPADMKTMQVNIDMPVYEVTKDLSAVQIDQMHVLFDFSADGIETKELYIVSNTGERTVKDVFDLGDGKFAALQLPLPDDADYIFFKPDDEERFIKLSGAFADTFPILPGDQPAQIMTSYLVPYSGKRVYTYTAPVNTAQVNFLLPRQGGVSLEGTGLSGPESMTLQDGASYQVYSYSDLKAGDTLNVTIFGKVTAPPRNKSPSNWIAIGAAFLGFGVIGVGVWWWRKPESIHTEDEEATIQSDETTLNRLVAQIAQLDEAYQQQGLSEEEFQRQRRELMQRAKQLL